MFCQTGARAPISLLITKLPFRRGAYATMPGVDLSSITHRKGILPEMHVQRREAAVAEGARAACADDT